MQRHRPGFEGSAGSIGGRAILTAVPPLTMLFWALLSLQSYAAASPTTAVSVGDRKILVKTAYIKKLDAARKQGVTIYYPAYVPARFSLSDVTVSKDDPKHLDYHLDFTNRANKLSFSVESAYSGIGDGPDGDRTLKGRSKAFGEFSVYFFKPGSEGNGTRQPYYLSSWMPDGKMQESRRKNLEESQGRFYHFYGSGITDSEALSIGRSLSPAKW